MDLPRSLHVPPSQYLCGCDPPPKPLSWRLHSLFKNRLLPDSANHRPSLYQNDSLLNGSLALWQPDLDFSWTTTLTTPLI